MKNILLVAVTVVCCFLLSCKKDSTSAPEVSSEDVKKVIVTASADGKYDVVIRYLKNGSTGSGTVIDSAVNLTGAYTKTFTGNDGDIINLKLNVSNSTEYSYRISYYGYILNSSLYQSTVGEDGKHQTIASSNTTLTSK